MLRNTHVDSYTSMTNINSDNFTSVKYRNTEQNCSDVSEVNKYSPHLASLSLLKKLQSKHV